MSSKFQTEIGIILGYLILLTGVIFWNWQPFHLLVSFILEYVTLLLVYLYIDAVLGKSIPEIIISTLSHLISGLAMGLVQAALIMLMAYQLEGEITFKRDIARLPWLIPSIAAPLLIMQLIRLRGKTFDIDLRDARMGDLIASAVTFPIIILAGMLAFELSGENEQFALVILVLARITVEIRNNHFRKKSSTKKKSLRKGGI